MLVRRTDVSPSRYTTKWRHDPGRFKRAGCVRERMAVVIQMADVPSRPSRLADLLQAFPGRISGVMGLLILDVRPDAAHLVGAAGAAAVARLPDECIPIRVNSRCLVRRISPAGRLAGVGQGADATPVRADLGKCPRRHLELPRLVVSPTLDTAVFSDGAGMVLSGGYLLERPLRRHGLVVIMIALVGVRVRAQLPALDGSLDGDTAAVKPRARSEIPVQCRLTAAVPTGLPAGAILQSYVAAVGGIFSGRVDAGVGLLRLVVVLAAHSSERQPDQKRDGRARQCARTTSCHRIFFAPDWEPHDMKKLFITGDSTPDSFLGQRTRARNPSPFRGVLSV